MIGNFLERPFHWLKASLAKLSAGWVGATIAILVVGSVIWADFSYGYFLSQPHWLFAVMATVIGIVLACLAAGVAMLAFGLLTAIPWYFLWSILVALLLIWIGFDDLDGDVSMMLAAYLLPPVALFGAGAGFFFSSHWRSRQSRGVLAPLAASLSLMVGTFYLGFIGVWLVSDGHPQTPPHDASATHYVKPLPLPNPAQQGPFIVHSLTYGSGLDKWRPSYGKGVDLITTSVNGTAFVDDWYGWAGWWRTYYWGFGPHALPRNGIVWYPEGKGPFPLVMILHGNTMMEKHSEEGYEYLGRLLASRGYIAVSVDQNFLNSSWHCLWQGIGGNNVRAWLLLEHIKLWRQWNDDSASQFYQKVDLNNIGLIGHSRGGEAVALAHTFNGLPYYPDDCTIPFDYRFGIKSVMAIAPVDGQYEPTGTPNRLKNVNYLVLHGAYDSDVRAFQGASQYQRTSFDDNTDWFKASAYVYGANHGQFNTDWGRYDIWPLEAWLLNVRPLMSAEDQQQIAQVYASAFLDTTLRAKTGYQELFRDNRSGRDWLPSTVFITAYEDGKYRFIADFDEDIDPTIPTIKGGKQYGHNLTIWREHEVCLKYGCMDTRAAFLGWDRAVGGDTPSYTIEMPDKALPVTMESSLVFSMADAKRESDEEDVIDLTVEVMDAAGHSAHLPLSHYRALQASFPACIWKVEFLDCNQTSDNVYQSFVFPMRDFVAVNADFKPEDLTTIRWLFDRTPSWEVILDDVGIRPY